MKRAIILLIAAGLVIAGVIFFTLNKVDCENTPLSSLPDKCYQVWQQKYGNQE